MALAAAIAALSTAGCAAPEGVRYGDVVSLPSAYTPAQRPLSIGEIVAAMRSGRSQHDLADEIDERGLLAPATSADIDLLLQSGADEELIDAVRDASSAFASGGGVPGNPPAMGTPPVIASPPVIVAPPAPFYPDYGWYPYAPYVPYGSFNFYYNDSPRFRPHLHRGDRFDRLRPEDRRNRPAPGAVAPNWQSPRAPGGSAQTPSRPGTLPPGGFIDRSGRLRVPLSEDGAPGVNPSAQPRVNPSAQPRGSVGAPKSGGGAIRNQRSVPE